MHKRHGTFGSSVSPLTPEQLAELHEKNPTFRTNELADLLGLETNTVYSYVTRGRRGILLQSAPLGVNMRQIRWRWYEEFIEAVHRAKIPKVRTKTPKTSRAAKEALHDHYGERAQTLDI